MDKVDYAVVTGIYPEEWVKELLTICHAIKPELMGPKLLLFRNYFVSLKSNYWGTPYNEIVKYIVDYYGTGFIPKLVFNAGGNRFHLNDTFVNVNNVIIYRSDVSYLKQLLCDIHREYQADFHALACSIINLKNN